MAARCGSSTFCKHLKFLAVLVIRLTGFFLELVWPLRCGGSSSHFCDRAVVSTSTAAPAPSALVKIVLYFCHDCHFDDGSGSIFVIMTGVSNLNSRQTLCQLRPWPTDAQPCRGIVVSADAMQDGSAVTSHANDCQARASAANLSYTEDCDFRVAYVPAP